MSDADVPVPSASVESRYTAPPEENPHAGRGSAVMLDIGGDIGAVVVTCPAELVGREIEVVPAGSRGPGGKYEHAPAEHTHDDHDHTHDGHDHEHEHEHEDAGSEHHGGFHASHQHPAGTPPHVGVVARPIGDRMVPTAVFGDLVQGRYEFSLRPFGGAVDLEGRRQGRRGRHGRLARPHDLSMIGPGSGPLARPVPPAAMIGGFPPSCDRVLFAR